LLITLLTVTSISCKKQYILDERERPPVTGGGGTNPKDSDENLLKDSVYYFGYMYSLWNTSLPIPQTINRQFDLRSFTQGFTRAEDVLENLKSRTPIQGNRPIDRFSFLDREGLTSSELQAGNTQGLGIHVTYWGDDLYIKMVDVGSPAARAGISRGYQITQINGRSDLSWESMLSTNFDFIYNALDASSINLSVKDLEGKDRQLDLVRSIYQTEPILSHTIFQSNQKKIGYLAFNSFVSISEGRVPNYMQREFNEIFQKFESEQIQELIVDIRYNGGGIVNTAEFLVNKIVPSSANNQLMFRYQMNDILSKDAQIKRQFADAYVRKTNNLQLPRVYFLVTNSTASASELLINSLKPFMNVQVIGTNNQNTFGKPVGFFGQPLVDNKAEVYITSFALYNNLNQGDYYAGLVPDKRDALEDLFKDFGQIDEPMIAQAIHHIQTGAYIPRATRNTGIAASRSIPVQELRQIENPRKVSGMYKMSSE